MIRYEVYKILHFVGLFMVVAAVGAQFLHAMQGGEKKHSAKKWLGMHSGIGLVFVLVGGMGMLARLRLGFDAWVFAKLAVWLYLGFAGAIAMRKRELVRPLWISVIISLGFATWCALTKPGLG